MQGSGWLDPPDPLAVAISTPSRFSLPAPRVDPFGSNLTELSQDKTHPPTLPLLSKKAASQSPIAPQQPSTFGTLSFAAAAAGPKPTWAFSPLKFPPRSSSVKDGKPAISFSATELQAGASRHQHTLVAKFSAGRPPVEDIRTTFESLWNLRGKASIGSWRDGRHILIVLQSAEDVNKVLSSPVRRVQHSMFRIFRWSPEYNPRKENPTITTWVRLPDVPLDLYDAGFFEQIVSSFGKFIDVDSKTKSLTNPSFGRVCVELDVRKLVPPAIWINLPGDRSYWQSIVTEGNLRFCSSYKVHGHDRLSCRKKPPTDNSGQGKHKPAPNSNIKMVHVSGLTGDRTTKCMGQPIPSLSDTMLISKEVDSNHAVPQPNKTVQLNADNSYTADHQHALAYNATSDPTTSELAAKPPNQPSMSHGWTIVTSKRSAGKNKKKLSAVRGQLMHKANHVKGHHHTFKKKNRDITKISNPEHKEISDMGLHVGPSSADLNIAGNGNTIDLLNTLSSPVILPHIPIMNRPPSQYETEFKRITAKVDGASEQQESSAISETQALAQRVTNSLALVCQEERGFKQKEQEVGTLIVQAEAHTNLQNSIKESLATIASRIDKADSQYTTILRPSSTLNAMDINSNGEGNIASTLTLLPNV